MGDSNWRGLISKEHSEALSIYVIFSYYCRFLYLNIFFICVKKWMQNIKFKVSAFIFKIKLQATFVQTALNSWAVIGWKMFKFPVQVFWTWSINIYLLELALDMRQLHRYLLLKALMYYLSIRRPVPSTNQAIPSCFYIRISWILMEYRCFFFFCPLGFLRGLRSLKHWLLQKLSMKKLDQNLNSSLKNRYFGALIFFEGEFFDP